MEKLIRYKGKLTLEQLILARSKTIENAKALYDEAMVLYENGMLARAYFLLCIANEEIGKSILILSAIVDVIAGTIKWSGFWKRLRNHKTKTGTIEHLENIFVSSDENFTEPKNIQQLIPILEEAKMSSLYSDMYQKDFYAPNEIVCAKLVEEYIKLTENRLEYLVSRFPSDETLRKIKKEDILDFRKKLGIVKYYS